MQRKLFSQYVSSYPLCTSSDTNTYLFCFKIVCLCFSFSSVCVCVCLRVCVFVFVFVCVDPWSWWWEFLWWFGALATGQISIMGAPDWPSLLSDHLINNTRDNALYTETYTYIELIHTRPDTQSTYDTLTFLEPIIPKNTRSPPHCKQVTETFTVKHYNKPLPGGIHYLDNSWSTQ